MSYNYFGCDVIEAPDGSAPAVGTGAKRTNPDKFVFSYQGDGDLASIGTAEIVHAAHRGEKITTIFINNAIYGMTGAESIPVLEAAAAKLSDDVSEDYWEATEGNAKRALLQLLAMARMRPDGDWDGV